MCVFFFNDTATTEIYTLSLHDALPISSSTASSSSPNSPAMETNFSLLGSRRIIHANLPGSRQARQDRKSTRLNSSHANISYAVFCLKKKKKNRTVLNTNK